MGAWRGVGGGNLTLTSAVELNLIVKLKGQIFITRSSFFSSPSYYVWGTLVILQILDCRFWADLHVLGSGESKKDKISMVSECSFVR